MQASDSCYTNFVLTRATFNEIQVKHENYDAADHIKLNINCDTSKNCANATVGCGKINEKKVMILEKSCDYMSYLSGAFYPCMRKLRLRKNKKCIANFFSENANCEEWKENRACLKWAIREECGTKFWEQYRPYWQKRTDLICGELEE